MLCNFGKNYALPLSLFAFAKKNHAEKVKLLRVPVKGQGAALCKLCNVDAIGGHTAYAKVGKGAWLAVFSFAGLAQGTGAVADSEHVKTVAAQIVPKAADGGAVEMAVAALLHGVLFQRRQNLGAFVALVKLRLRKEAFAAFPPACRNPAGRRGWRYSFRSGFLRSI